MNASPQLGKRLDLQKLVLLGLLAFIILFFTMLNGRFLSVSNILYMLIQNSFVIITGCAVTLLMVAGYIDLSVGSTLALTGVASAWFCRAGIPLGWSMLLAVMIGLVIGILNAALIVRLNVTPFIATLGTMYLGRGLSYLVTNGMVIRDRLPSNFTFLGNENLGPVPILVIVMVVVALIFYILQKRSVLGKYSVAVGGNRTAAFLSGIHTEGLVEILYIFASLMAAISGVLMASSLGVGDPNIGIGFEFDVIVAIVLGGTSLAGGEGSILGMIIAALIIGTLSNGLKIMNVFTFYQSVMKGIVLVAAIVIDQRLKTRIRAFEARASATKPQPEEKS